MTMYAGLVNSVEIPKGRVKILKNGYVYWITESHWDNDRKMTIDNRVIIGKLDESGNNKMYPNKKYFDIFGGDPDKKGKDKAGMNSILRDLNVENFRGINKLIFIAFFQYVLKYLLK